MQLKEMLKSLPDSPGVYQFFDLNGRLLYIGKAKSLKNRVKSYFSLADGVAPAAQLGLRIGRMISDTASLNYILVESESDALILENSLIKQLKPRYNILMRDDKTYPYIYIDMSERYPRPAITRKVVGGRQNRNIKYFGPFTGGAKLFLDAIYESLPLVQKANCIKQKKACLFYQIKRCPAPCEFEVPFDEYKKTVELAVELIENKERLVKLLNEKMASYAESERYEDAARMRDAADAVGRLSVVSGVDFAKDENFDLFALAVEGRRWCFVRLFVRNGKVSGSSHSAPRVFGDEGFDENEAYRRALLEHYDEECPVVPSKIFVADDFEDLQEMQEFLSARFGKKISVVQPKVGDKKRLSELAVKNGLEILRLHKNEQQTTVKEQLVELLGLSNEPQRVEIFDNSHMMGSSPVAAMVVWDEAAGSAGWDKSSYRHYNLSAVDEYAQMREALMRRIESFPKNPPPDLWLLDGGKAVLELARNLLESGGVYIDIVAIAKEKVDAKAHRAKGAANDLIYIDGEILRLSSNDKRLQFLQRLRDEAHRFAIEFHRKQKRKSDKQIELLRLKGIGEAKLKRLLDYFGSFEAIYAADKVALMQAVSEKDAKAILGESE